MKAAGITLSTVGAGGGSNPFLAGPRAAGRRPLLRRREPGKHPRHLPEGDPAGLRPADHRGAVLPDPDLVLADPARPRGRAAAAARLQRHDGQAGRPDRAGHGARRSAPGPVAVRARPVRGVDVGLDRSLGARLAGLGRVLAVLQPARVVDVPGRGDRRHRGRLRRPRRPDDAPCRERRGGRLTARLLLDRRRSSSGPTSARPRSSSCRSRRACTRCRSARSSPGAYGRAHHADETGLDAARADGRPGRTDRRRVPAARRERAVPDRRCAPRPAGPRS